ncbi:MAG: serine/threonine-protein kinase [Planctomycetota bacterium]|nr:serine/threonine-protein kinase [Planctomycetota bacterium]
MASDSRYELLEKVGAGSFATVYRARDTELGREVAIKQIHDQYLQMPEQMERYWQEAQLLAQLQHPNIITFFDIDRERGWLIMELMQGNLADRITTEPLDLKSVRTSLAHCLRALKYLHSQGIVHGDVKPANMMIDSRKRIKLGDFGLSRRVSDEDGSLLKGTTKYMAPEVMSEDFGEVGPSSDLYSLGFAAYELMCGPNFESLFPGLNAFGRDRQVGWMMWHAAPDRNLPEISRVLQGVPEDLAHVVQKLVSKDQSRRYQTATEALSELQIDIKIVKTGHDAPADESTDTTRRNVAIAAFCGSPAGQL